MNATDATRAIGVGRASKRRLSAFEWVSLGLGGLMAAIFLYTVFMVLFRSFWVDGRLDFAGFLAAFQLRGLWTAVTNTVIIVVIAGAISVVIGTLMAWLNERTDARMGVLGTVLPIVPLLLPPIALSIGWYTLTERTVGYLNSAIRGVMPWIGDTGPFDIATWPGLIMVYVLYEVPFVYLTVSAAFRNVNPALEEASRVSGAGRIRTLFKVSLPAVRPAIAASFLLVTLSAFALYSVPVIIGTAAKIDALPVFIVQLIRATTPSKTTEATSISLIMMTILFLLWLVQQRISRGRNFDKIGGKATAVSLVRLGAWKLPARILMFGYVALASVLPLIGLVILSLSKFWGKTIDWGNLSFDNYVTLLVTDVNSRTSLINSLGLGFVGATLGMAIAAIIMTQAAASGGWFKKFLSFVTTAPGAVPHIILAIGILAGFSGSPFFLYGTVIILLVAYVVMNLPQASLQAGSAIQQIGGELMEASSMSGASRSRTFWRVTFPLMLPGLASGWAMLFVLMVGDLTASALLAGSRNPVVGFVILGIWENGLVVRLAALAVVLCLICGTVICAALILARQLGKTTTSRKKKGSKR